MELEQIYEVIADVLDADVEKLSAKTEFQNDLEADSLDLMEIIMALEEKTGVEIPTDQAEKIKTIGDAYEEINKLLKK